MALCGRKRLSAFGNFYARSILGLPLHDVTTGYRLWRRETLAGMPFEAHPVQRVYFFGGNGLSGALPGVQGWQSRRTLFADRRFGKSKMSLKNQMEAAMRVWQVWWNYRDLRSKGKMARVGAV